MAEYGFDVPCSKKTSDAIRRRHIFDIIAPYCFSRAELAEIATYSDTIQDLWLQSFTNSQSVMVKSKLLQAAKDYFRSFSPEDGAAPRQAKAKRIGLPTRVLCFSSTIAMCMSGSPTFVVFMLRTRR